MSIITKSASNHAVWQLSSCTHYSYMCPFATIQRL